jgi:uncharacterized protein YdaU (DUF1376 family)
MHYYQFNIGDWGLGTSHLSLEEEAIYLRLINHYYDTEKPIQEETQWVIRRLRLGADISIVESVLSEFFTLTDRGWEHKRCEEMLKVYRKTVKKNRENGKKGGRPRKDAALKETQEKPSGLPLGTQSEPTGNPNQEPLTNNHKPTTSNQVKEVEKQPPAAAVKSPVDFSVFNASDDQISEMKRIRRLNKGGAMSQRVVNSLAKEFAQAQTMGYTFDDCLTEWETAGWKSMKADWVHNRIGGNNGSHQQASQQPGQIDHDDTSWGDKFLSEPGHDQTGQPDIRRIESDLPGMEAGFLDHQGGERS